MQNFFQETMPRVCFTLENWHCILFMWKMSKTLRKLTTSWTRRPKTPYQFPVTSSKRTSPMVPNRELPSGNECTTKPKICCGKLANPSMVGTKPSWKDGTRMTITASICLKLGGLKSRYSERRTCIGRSLLYCNKRGKNSERDKLGTMRAEINSNDFGGFWN